MNTRTRRDDAAFRAALPPVVGALPGQIVSTFAMDRVPGLLPGQHKAWAAPSWVGLLPGQRERSPNSAAPGLLPGQSPTTSAFGTGDCTCSGCGVKKGTTDGGCAHCAAGTDLVSASAALATNAAPLQDWGLLRGTPGMGPAGVWAPESLGPLSNFRSDKFQFGPRSPSSHIRSSRHPALMQAMAGSNLGWNGRSTTNAQPLVNGPVRVRSLNRTHLNYDEREFWWAHEDMSEEHIALIDEAFAMINDSNQLWSSLQGLADYYDLPRHPYRHRVNRDRHLSMLNGEIKLRFFVQEVDDNIAHSYILDKIRFNERYLDGMLVYLIGLSGLSSSSDLYSTRRNCVISELASTIVHETAHAASFVQGQGEGFAYLSEYYWKRQYQQSLRRGMWSLEECCAENSPRSWYVSDYPTRNRESIVREQVCYSGQTRTLVGDQYVLGWDNCGRGGNC